MHDSSSTRATLGVSHSSQEKGDIVERLRFLADLVDESQQRNTATGNVSREAADEIEFLRTALAQSEQRTELWKAQCQRDQAKLRELGVLPTA